jgi:CRISPR/Cas system CSM-associated protein Csm3 (group 7 of RAMP superfamily)
VSKKNKAHFPKRPDAPVPNRSDVVTAQRGPGWVRCNLTAELLSDAHLGSGSGGGGIHALVARDRHDRPVIWASHVEGVLRDAARRLHDDDRVAGNFFGRAGGEQQRAVFSSLYAKENPESRVWRSTAREAFDNRAPKEDTLRVIEHVPKGTKFIGEVELPASELETLKRLIQEVDALGGGRSVGAGRVKLSLSEVASMPLKSWTPTGRLVLLLKNRDPLCITATATPDNLLPSLAFVPGRTLLGAVAAWLIAEGDRDTASLLTSGKVSVSDALPLPHVPSKLDGVEVLPAPLSLQSEKPEGSAGDVPWWAQPTARMTRLDAWEAKWEAKEKLKRPEDDLFVCRENENAAWITFRPARRVRLRNGRPDPKQPDASLFAVEQIVEETPFLAELRGSPDDLKKLADKLAPVLGGQRWLRMGRAGAPVEVAQLAWSGAAPTAKIDGKILLTLTSDLLVRDEHLRWRTALDEQVLRELVGSEQIAIVKSEQGGLRELQDSVMVHGFNGTSRVWRMPAAAVRRGSVFEVTGAGVAKLAERAAKNEWLGERTHEGFGRFRLDAALPGVTSEVGRSGQPGPSADVPGPTADVAEESIAAKTKEWFDARKSLVNGWWEVLEAPGCQGDLGRSAQGPRPSTKTLRGPLRALASRRAAQGAQGGMMTTKLTLFTATLVQDSALSVSGLDRETSANQPFALVDGVPTLVGRGLKGAAVAMAKRFFDPLPRAVSDDIKHGALRRSAWEFENATTEGVPRIRAGVGIRHKTGARADGVLYDREVIPAGTKWKLRFRVDRSFALDDAEFTEAEGILGYVLAEHWANGRCWLGGGAARGLGWCHVDELRAYRFDEAGYEAWVKSGRTTLPVALTAVPVVSPTRSWCFRTLDVNISFGEYKPEPTEAAWGLDMFAVGPDDSERAVQLTGDGEWAKPAWAMNMQTPDALATNRALLMDNRRPLLPGASVRGPLRHAFSRRERASGSNVKDPHLVQGDVGEDDPAGKAFGTVSRSSRILIRDARAEGGWAAAKLHMHAEDEFSAGSYGNAKREAVRVLKGSFPVRILVEGAEAEDVERLVKLIDQQVAVGALGHLIIGGHKTRGAGAGHWQAKPWVNADVTKARDWTAPKEPDGKSPDGGLEKRSFLDRPAEGDAWVRTETGAIIDALTLGAAAKRAKEALGETLVAWWCDPTIDLDLHTPPTTFGREWPDAADKLHVDEIAFYAERAVWRAVRTSNGARFVFIEELASKAKDAKQTRVIYTPARLHGFQRFSSANTGRGNVLLREWHVGDEILGFTLTTEFPGGVRPIRRGGN